MKTESKKALNLVSLDEVVHKATLNFRGMPPKNKSDKQEARIIEVREGMTEGTFTASKALIGKGAMSSFDSAKKALMDYYYKNSLPPDAGKNSYVLVSNKYMGPFTTRMRELVRATEDAFSEFLREYGHNDPEKRTQWLHIQKQRLGGKYEESDYPEPDKLAAEFKVTFHMTPFGDITQTAGMWVDHETLALLGKREADTNKMMLDYASQAVWERVIDPLESIVERLSAPEDGDKANSKGGKTFRDSLVTNLRDIMKTLPALNFQGDTRLEEVATKCKELLNGMENPEALRKNPEKREAVKNEASEILDTIGGYSGKRSKKG